MKVSVLAVVALLGALGCVLGMGYGAGYGYVPVYQGASRGSGGLGDSGLRNKSGILICGLFWKNWAS